MHVTLNESLVLDSIARNLMAVRNGGRPKTAEEATTWRDQIISDGPHETEIKPRSLPGIVASLVKKGLITSNGESVTFTLAGFEVWERLYPDLDLQATVERVLSECDECGSTLYHSEATGETGCVHCHTVGCAECGNPDHATNRCSAAPIPQLERNIVEAVGNIYRLKRAERIDFLSYMRGARTCAQYDRLSSVLQAAVNEATIRLRLSSAF